MKQHTFSRRSTAIVFAGLVVLLASGLVVAPVAADVEVDAGRGPVTVNVPPTYDPSEPAPLIMMLHSYGSSAAWEEPNYWQLLPWSDQLGFLYVAPEGTVDPEGDRFWNATDACCDWYGTGVDDSAYLRALIDAIIEELSVDTERIYLLGHSNGGFMSYRMACDHADLVAAVVSVAGATFADPADCNPSQPVRTLEIHGTDDWIIDYEGGTDDLEPYPGAVETTEIWATYNGCSLTPDLSHPPLDIVRDLPGSETTVARYVDGCEPGGSSELWTIVGGGHGPALSYDSRPLILNFLLSDGGPAVLPIHRQFIPAAALASGAEGSFYQTDVDLNNASDQATEYEFLWLPRGQNNIDSMTSEPFSLGAGMSVRYANILSEVFGLEPNSLGALILRSSSPDLLAMSRTYNNPGGEDAGTFGQAIPAIPPSDFIQTGERRRILFASENDDLRFNVGCQSGSLEGTMVVNLELFDNEGSSLERTMMILQRWSNDQLNRLFQDYMPVNGYVDVWTTVANRSFYCYGSVLDNVTSDPTTILPQ